MKKIRPNQPVPVPFTLAERDLILNEIIVLEDELVEKLKTAPKKSKTEIEVMYTLQELENLNEFVSAEANHAQNAGLQKKLDTLSDRLEEVLESYEEAD